VTSRFSKSRLNLWAVGLCVLLGVFTAVTVFAESAEANPFEDTIDILENQTVFHWGRDCLVWLVHYPEELVDPWVEAESGRAGMTDSEREAYKKSFVSELSIGEREPFLFTVYAFGPRSLSFSPFLEKVALVTSDGERVKPVRYDEALDQPVNGIVQGLVFFPKQQNREFAVAVQGMGVHEERLFSFGTPSLSPAGAVQTDAEQEDEGEVVVLELPPKSSALQTQTKPPVPQKTRSETPPPQRQTQQPKEIERPPLPSAPSAASAPPAPAAPEIAIIEPEEQTMAEFVEAMRSGDRSAPPPAKEAETEPELADSAYESREKTVREFLSLWAKNDPETMYSMLSDSSRKLFSRETFAAELRKSSDFRAALRDGYKLEWLGTERARVVAVKRILLIRTLVSRTLGVAREGAAWKIVW
jgi:hypothetical protein